MPLSHPHCVPPGWMAYLVSLLGLSLEFNMCCMASLANTTAHKSESEDVVGMFITSLLEILEIF